MSHKFHLIFLFLISVHFFTIAQSRQEKAKYFLHQLEREQFDSCAASFDTLLSNKVSTVMLSKIWASFPQYFGDYKGISEVKSEWKDSLEKVTMLCAFERVKVNLNLVYAPSDKIVGITFVPAGSALSYKLPGYAKLSAYSEQKLVIESGKYKLPAVLCLPNNVKNPTVAVLLAGSGPNDKDETIGPNKILKDLAVGLASMGVASLRYDKRTLVYGEEFQKSTNITIQEEVVEDALSAVKLLGRLPETKSSKLMVVGHSLGGMCAPLVALKSSKIKAVVMLAANARPLEDLLPEQFEYIYSLDSLDADEKKDLLELNRQVKMVKDPVQLKRLPADSLPLGVPYSYWQSLNKYDQVATAKKLRQPILVLQGKRDYQVVMKDFEIWKTALQSSEKNKFIVYDKLNHLFLSGEGKSTPAEYQKQGNVEEEVIRNIADWLKALH